jgi:hypothetical protein
MDKNTPLGRRAMMEGIRSRQNLIDSGAIDDATKKAYREWIEETMDILAEPLEKNIAKASPIRNEIEDYLIKQSGEMAKAAEKNIVKAGSAGKALRGLSKVAGPVGVALTASEMGGALSELRKLGAEKIAEKNNKLTAEERLRIKDLLKKLRADSELRD